MANNSKYGSILFERLLEAYEVDNGNQLAEKCGISLPSVSKWKTGKSAPEFDKLVKAHNDTGVSIDWLLMGKEPKKSITISSTGDLDIEQLKQESVRDFLIEQLNGYTVGIRKRISQKRKTISKKGQAG